jgi:hypothetical protein
VHCHKYCFVSGCTIDQRHIPLAPLKCRPLYGHEGIGGRIVEVVIGMEEYILSQAFWQVAKHLSL